MRHSVIIPQNIKNWDVKYPPFIAKLYDSTQLEHGRLVDLDGAG